MKKLNDWDLAREYDELEDEEERVQEEAEIRELRRQVRSHPDVVGQRVRGLLGEGRLWTNQQAPQDSEQDKVRAHARRLALRSWSRTGEPSDRLVRLTGVSSGGVVPL